MSESTFAKEIRDLKERKGKCPCGRCKECELARMVRNNWKILMEMSGMGEEDDERRDVGTDATADVGAG